MSKTRKELEEEWFDLYFTYVDDNCEYAENVFINNGLSCCADETLLEAIETLKDRAAELDRERSTIPMYRLWEKTSAGFQVLLGLPTNEADRQKWWDGLSQKEQDAVKDIPNVNADFLKKYDINVDAADKGTSNIGHNNSGDFNVGNNNEGDFNVGDFNSGSKNVGYGNFGSKNVGDFNEGGFNTGDGNEGSYNVGDMNSGDYNVGSGNSGNGNAGKSNAGNFNTGHTNVGSKNTGNFNIGNLNTGDFNLSDGNTGCFCTRPQKILLFDKPSNLTFAEWRSSSAYKVLRHMPLEKADRQEWWSSLSEEDRDIVREIPNFDPEIFKTCTGINPTEK